MLPRCKLPSASNFTRVLSRRVNTPEQLPRSIDRSGLPRSTKVETEPTRKIYARCVVSKGSERFLSKRFQTFSFPRRNDHSRSINSQYVDFVSGAGYGSGLRCERHGELHASRGKNGKRAADGAQRYRRHLRENTVGQGNRSLPRDSRHRYRPRYVQQYSISFRPATLLHFSSNARTKSVERKKVSIHTHTPVSISPRNESFVTEVGRGGKKR